MTQQENNRIIKNILDIGEMLLRSGGEVSRVEDTMTRMFQAYGFLRADVFTITSSIVVTVYTKENEILTQTRRIFGSEMNLERVHQLNQLARSVCARPVTIEELEYRIEQIKNTKGYSKMAMMLFYGGTAAAFSIFFGGRWMECCIGGLTGIGLYILLQILENLVTNPIVQYMICSAAGGFFLCILKKAGFDYQIEPTMMGNIMLLIPGLAFTNGIREMLAGDTMSGLLRLCESLVRTVAIAAGFVGIMHMFGGMPI